MNQFSLLVRLQQPSAVLVQRMMDSVLSQTNTDWELVLVTDLANQPVATALAQGHPNVRVALRPDGELLAWSCNALLPTLGAWIGFLGQHDQLTLAALDAMAVTITGHPQACVVYSDEESVSYWGQVSLRFSKGAPDHIRLMSEEYFRDLALIQKSWLESTKGFDRQASDQPRHALYLRVLEVVGVVGFAHVPQRLYRRHRQRRVTGWSKHLSASRAYLPGYDLQGARQHYEREGIDVKLKQLNGTLDPDYQFERQPSVTVLLLVGEDTAVGKRTMTSLTTIPGYQPWTAQVLYAGNSDQVRDYYAKLAQALHFPFLQLEGNLPDALSQEVARADTDLTLLLQGLPISAHWLKRLVALAGLPGISAAGGMLLTPPRLAEPGIHASAEGAPWNSRGTLNQLAVPHSVSTLSPACLLFDTRKFLEIGGFESAYPTLYGRDFTMRLSKAGYGCARSPGVQIQVHPWVTPEPEELSLFRTEWAGWEDPYGLHQLP